MAGDDDRPSGRRQIVAAVFWAAVLGLLISVPLGRQRQISVELWLVAVSIWLARTAISNMFATAPLRASSPRPIWRWRRRDEAATPHRPSELTSLEGLLLSARDNDRSFSLRLQPRLIRLADHYLQVHHGIDRTSDPEAAAAMLGDVAWLLDPSQTGTTPTMAEVDRLVDLVTASPDGLHRQPRLEGANG